MYKLFFTSQKSQSSVHKITHGTTQYLQLYLWCLTTSISVMNITAMAPQCAHAPLLPHASIDSATTGSELKVSSGSDSDHGTGSEADITHTPVSDVALPATDDHHRISPAPACVLASALDVGHDRPDTPTPPVFTNLSLARRSPRTPLATLRATPTPRASATSPALAMAHSRSTGALRALVGYSESAVGRPDTPTADAAFITSPIALAYRLDVSEMDTYENLNQVLAQIDSKSYDRSNSKQLESALEFARKHRKLDAALRLIAYCQATHYPINIHITEQAHQFLQTQAEKHHRETARYLAAKQVKLTKILAAEIDRATGYLTLQNRTLAAITHSIDHDRAHDHADKSSSEFGYRTTDSPSPVAVAHPTAVAVQQAYAAQTAQQLVTQLKHDFRL